MEEDIIRGKYLRTLLREDVYNTLEEYAKGFQNGLGKWDFGVAIERLLDSQNIMMKIQELEARLDDLECSMLSGEGKVDEKKEKKREFLGSGGEENENK